jgi:modulator of FtsH protease HflK
MLQSVSYPRKIVIIIDSKGTMMSSNEDKKEDIWRENAQTPPDLISVLKKIFGGRSGGGTEDGQTPEKNPIGKLIAFGAVIVLVLWGLSGIFILGPTEQSVILRFGEYQSTVGPGMHWIPRFIDSKYSSDVQQVRYFKYQAEMLTQDENLVSVALNVQYRIDNLRSFLFNTSDPIETLQQGTSSALRQVVGHMKLDDILTTGRQDLRDKANQQLLNTLAIYKTGIVISDVTLMQAKPPEAVTPAFDDAIRAREDEQSYINQAKAYTSKVVPIAKGQVARLQQSASAYEKSVVAEAKGRTVRYLALLKPYLEAPTVTRERLYLDTVADVLSHTRNIVVGSGGNNVLYLPLSQLMQGQASVNPPMRATTNLNAKKVDTAASEPDQSGYGQDRPSGYPEGGLQ